MRIRYCLWIVVVLWVASGCRAGNTAVTPSDLPGTVVSPPVGASLTPGVVDPAAAALEAIFAGDSPLLYIGGDGRMEDRHIYRSDADGSNAFCVTCDSNMRGAYSSPVWAPDRSSFAYIYDESEVVLQTRAGQVITLLSGDGFYRDLRWSPDGAALAFSFEARLENGSRAPGQICTLDISLESVAAAKHCWTESGYNRSPEWSPDGSSLLFAHSQEQFSQSDLILLRLADRSQTNLTNTEGQNELYPRWREQRILFVRREGQVPDVWLMNADGGDPVCLTPGEGDGNWPEWSPDGTRIVFVTTRTSQTWDHDVPFAGYSELYLIKADGFDLTNITNDPAVFVSQPSWAR